MKKIVYMFSIVLTFISCNENKRNINNKVDSAIKDLNIVNILEHPLIFEEIDLKIESFTSEEEKNGTFLLNITISSTDIEKYSKGHFFFIHAFDYYHEKDTDFINMDTRNVVMENNTIQFERTLETNVYDYKEFRFGLANMNTKKRYFVRTLKNVSIKK